MFGELEALKQQLSSLDMLEGRLEAGESLLDAADEQQGVRVCVCVNWVLCLRVLGVLNVSERQAVHVKQHKNLPHRVREGKNFVLTAWLFHRRCFVKTIRRRGRGCWFEGGV